jgi:TIR domain
MSDIFISYASADRERAKLLAETLVRRGWSVWWDRTIPPGQEYDKVIEKALDSAKCVVVLWSNVSAASSWVKTEAAEAMRRTILVPALLDHVTIPLEFRRLQAADLSHWHGEPSHPELQKFFDSIEVKIHDVGETPPIVKSPVPPAVQPPPPPNQPARWTRAVWPAIALVGALVGVAAGLMLSRTQQAEEPEPVVSVPPDRPTRTPPPPQQSSPTTPDPVVSPPVLEPAPPVKQPPPAGSPAVGKRPQPVAPVPVAPVARPAPPEPPATRPALPEPPTSPLVSTDLPAVAPAAPKLPVQEFEEILLVVNNQGEVEELDATLVFDDTSLVLRDEDSKILRTLPYSSLGKASYSRTQRRVMFVRTTRHQLTLGAGREEVVLRLPDATYQSILYQIEKRTGIKVAH